MRAHLSYIHYRQSLNLNIFVNLKILLIHGELGHPRRAKKLCVHSAVVGNEEKSLVQPSVTL